jgi:DNA-binding LacI/PurR family transcriptional regulator
MRQTRITAADVAERAGVSQPTVSRVFAPGSRVSTEKQQKVRAAAAELGYRPNTLARSLNTGKSRTIGVVVAYLNNPFYPEALQRFSEALRAHGYHVMVFFAANLAEEVDGVIEDLLAHQVDGIILASVSLSNQLTRRLRKTDIPFVLFNRGQDDPRLPLVSATNLEGGRIAARFLAEGGHHHIAHISGWQKSLNGRERQQGLIEGLAEYNLKPIRCIDSHFRREMAIEATRELFAASQHPDAIFVGNDHMAFAVLETLKYDIGLNVPDDVSVIGFDDVEMSAWQTFNLTTLRQPVNRMVAATVVMIMDMINRRPTQLQVEIESELMVRGSARIPANWPTPTARKATISNASG